MIEKGNKERNRNKRKSMVKISFVILCAVFLNISHVFAAVEKRKTPIPDVFPKIPPYPVVKFLIPVLKKGTVVIIQREKGKTPFITGIVLIDAPLDKVLSVVRDWDRYHEFVPNVSRVRVVKKFPEGGTEIVEYNLAFDVMLGLKFKISYTLLQHFIPSEYIIWGIPAETGKQAFRDVKFIEKYYATPDGKRTIMIYSAYADLASFGFLSKIVYRAFPELQIPSLVAVSTLFPEAVKERIEGKKLIVEPRDINYKEVKIPDRIPLKAILPILRIYRNIIISWYPDKNNVRFFSSFFLTKKGIDDVKGLVTDFTRWPKIFKIVQKVKKEDIPQGYKVKFYIKYKVVFPIKIRYTSIYEWDMNGNRLKCRVDRTEKRDIEGGFCAWDFYSSKWGTIVGFTEFSDLRTGNFFLKVLMDKIKGFGIGLRVAMVSAFSNMLSKELRKRY